MGCYRKNPHPPRQMGFWKFSWVGGSQRLWKSRREGVKLEKVFCRGHFDHSSRDSNVQFGDTSVLSDLQNSRNILFTDFSPNINDNLSSFTGLFIAENVNNKILKNVPSQRCPNEAFETPDTALLVPRPSVPPLCNFTLALLKSWLHWTNLKAIFSRF